MLRTLTVAIAVLTSSTALLAAPADLIIRDAHIVTVDPNFSTATAAAIQAGRFTAVGTDAEVLKTRGPNTRVVDLHGQTVLPGFNDTHVHLTSGKSLEIQVDLTNIHSIADIQSAIAARVQRSRPGEWIVGTRGWWEYDLSTADCRPATISIKLLQTTRSQSPVRTTRLRTVSRSSSLG